eukprot:CAMPEP_0116977976 /NCGR_PEP_ID=MMETSP0467-20121206/57477_1 /TAXON_ID=283647 /ORGANISM="Mesodinium pulex, Strain SPMC105" /LENGTH=233 /DNA_ID=CAMNT_0004671199 /DNA_START=627 /DNA_END=1329 /DNA_ORIENTATION=+
MDFCFSSLASAWVWVFKLSVRSGDVELVRFTSGIELEWDCETSEFETIPSHLEAGALSGGSASCPQVRVVDGGLSDSASRSQVGEVLYTLTLRDVSAWVGVFGFGCSFELRPEVEGLLGDALLDVVEPVVHHFLAEFAVEPLHFVCVVGQEVLFADHDVPDDAGLVFDQRLHDLGVFELECAVEGVGLRLGLRGRGGFGRLLVLCVQLLSQLFVVVKALGLLSQRLDVAVDHG